MTSAKVVTAASVVLVLAPAVADTVAMAVWAVAEAGRAVTEDRQPPGSARVVRAATAERAAMVWASTPRETEVTAVMVAAVGQVELAEQVATRQRAVTAAVGAAALVEGVVAAVEPEAPGVLVVEGPERAAAAAVATEARVVMASGVRHSCMVVLADRAGSAVEAVNLTRPLVLAAMAATAVSAATVRLVGSPAGSVDRVVPVVPRGRRVGSLPSRAERAMAAAEATAGVGKRVVVAVQVVLAVQPLEIGSMCPIGRVATVVTADAVRAVHQGVWAEPAVPAAAPAGNPPAGRATRACRKRANSWLPTLVPAADLNPHNHAAVFTRDFTGRLVPRATTLGSLWTQGLCCSAC